MENQPYGFGGIVPIGWLKPVTTILILILASLGTLVPGVLLLVIEVRRAPLGHEDDAGFHFGRAPGEAEDFLTSLLTETGDDSPDASFAETQT